MTDLLFFFDSVAVGAALAEIADGTVTAMALEGLVEESRLGAGGDSVRIIAKGNGEQGQQRPRPRRPKK